MRSLKDIYPEFAGNVDFYAINTDPSEGIGSIAEFAENQGYPWPVAQPESGTLAALNVTYQSTKLAFGGDGVIIYRDGFGAGSPDRWQQVFEELER